MACVSEHIFEGNDKGQIFSDKIKVILTKITLNPYTNIFYFFQMDYLVFLMDIQYNSFLFVWVSLNSIISVVSAQNSLLLSVKGIEMQDNYPILKIKIVLF